MATKRKHDTMASKPDEDVDPADKLMFLCLGGGAEVGRSCHIIQYKGKTVMLDAGMHPGYEGLAAMPFYDEFDLSTVDVLLISHFHVDHAASLPYVLSKTNFRGRVFMTHPTKAIYKWLIQDSVRVGNMSSSAESKIQMYTEEDHLNTFPRIEAFDFYSTHTISGVRVTPYPAGHVLGAAMFLIDIAGLKIMFTGDYSREDDRHLVSASVPKDVKIDVLITESTFGISTHTPRALREQQLLGTITEVLSNKGRALLPVFALGRAQELLLILEEHWSKNKSLQKVPIYYNSSLARKCMLVYQTYISAMNDNIKRMAAERNAEAEAEGNTGRAGPWDFRYVRSLKSLDRFDDVGPCVMLASPGMLQSGISRELLERWAPNSNNAVIITGYSVEGTMAKAILHEPSDIPAVMTRGSTARRPGQKEGEENKIKRNCRVHEFSFAAHVDGKENIEFVEEVAAPVVILVHGEKGNMTRLKSKLLGLNSHKPVPVKILSPANGEPIYVPFKTEKIAKVVGKLASVPPPMPHTKSEGGDEVEQQKLIAGVLVQNDFKISLMAPEDLKEYAGLTTTTVACRQHLTLSAAGIDLIQWALEGTFGAIKEETITDAALEGKSVNGTTHEHADEEVDRTTKVFTVMDCVNVLCHSAGRVEVEWEGNMLNDGIADAVLAVLFTVESSPAAVKQSSQSHSHSPPPSSNAPLSLSHRFKSSTNPHKTQDASTRLSRLFLFLESQFGEDAISPIPYPRSSTLNPANQPAESAEQPNGTSDGAEQKDTPNPPAATSTNGEPYSVAALPLPTSEYSPEDKAELKRLHNLGIPVPGIEIRVDTLIAKVWLEDLDVDVVMRNGKPLPEKQKNRGKPLVERVRAVVERGVETVSGLWS